MSSVPTPPPTPLELVRHGLAFVLSASGYLDVKRLSDGHHLDQIWPTEAPADADALAALAEEWVARRLGAVAPEPLSCAGCGTLLHSATGADTTRQFDDALVVSFEGGYGMFVDDGPLAEPRQALVCGHCATALGDAFAWIAALLAPRL